MITAMDLSCSFELCVAHRDGAFLWDNGLSSDSNEHALLDGTGLKSQCSFNPQGTLVAIPVDCIVYIVDVDTKRSVVQLEGHGAVVTSVAFNPHRPQQLATASEDRSFKLWDVMNRCLLYQSSIVSMSPFTTLAFDPYRERLVVGSEDGKLRFYMLTLPSRGTETTHVREERMIDVGTLLRKRAKLMTEKNTRRVSGASGASSVCGSTDIDGSANPDTAPHVVSSLPSWARGGLMTSNENNEDDDNDQEQDNEEVEQVDTTMLSLYFRRGGNSTTTSSQAEASESATRRRRDEGLGWHGTGVLDEMESGDCEGEDNSDGNGDTKSPSTYWKEKTTWMIVGTPNALIHVDTSSYEIDTVLSFRDAEAANSSSPLSWGSISSSAIDVPPAPASPTTTTSSINGGISALPFPSDRGILSPLSAQAMAMGTARQKQAVPLAMTASCFAFACHEGQRAEVVERAPRRANRIEYYKKRLTGQVSQPNAPAPSSAIRSSLLCVVGSAFVPNATILKLPREPITSFTPMPRLAEPTATLGNTKTAADEDPTAPSGVGGITTIPSSVVVAAPPRAPTLSLFPTRPLATDSSLRNSEFKASTPPKKQSTPRKGRHNAMNQPVTFHRNIRSSGYGKKAPVMTLHGKKKKRPSKYRNNNSNHHHSNSITSGISTGGDQYPMDCPIPTHHQIAHQITMDGPHLKGTLHNGPILKLRYTRDASHLATCSTDRTATSMRLPCSRFTEEKHRSVHLGHDGPVHSIDWSHNAQSQLLLTASTDGTARMWERGRSDAVLTFDRWQKNSTTNLKLTSKSRIGHVHSLGGGGGGSSSSGVSVSGSGTFRSSQSASALLRSHRRTSNSSTSSNTTTPTKQKKKNPLFGTTSVTQASFAYMDTFVMLSVGNSLCLYKYAVDRLDGAKDDLQRLQNKSRYRLVQKYTQEGCQTITSFAHANSFYSTLVITGGSNRSVNLYDMGMSSSGSGSGSSSTGSVGNGNKPVVTIADAHSRSVTSVALPSFSEYASVPNAAYDVFLTSGAEGTVKLWDVRDPMRAVRTFSCHMRSTAMSIDPTMRYLACASRDAPNVLSVYDLRAGGLLDGIQCGSEAITDVAFSPRHPQMCVGSADGRIRFFTP